jgi:hypothetical protein
VSDWEISPRLGLKVFPNKGGNITIQQIDDMGEEHCIIVYQDDVPTLIRYLEEVRQQLQQDLLEEDLADEIETE